MFNLKNYNNQMAHWKLSDYIFFFVVVPAFLILIYLLPLSIKDSMVLYASNPTPFSIFFSNYVHLAPMHLLSNLIFYLVILFVIFNLETTKKELYVASLSFFLVLPVVISLLNLYFLGNILLSHNISFLGFSGIVSAFMGYLLYTLYKYFKQNYYNLLHITFYGLFVFINLLLVTIFSLTNVSILFILLILFIIFICFIYNINPIIQILRKGGQEYLALISQKSRGKLVYAFIMYIVTFIFVFYLSSIMPSTIASSNGFINILGHYIGFSFALMISITMIYYNIYVAQNSNNQTPRA